MNRNRPQDRRVDAVSREEYLALDNRITCLKDWPPSEVRTWLGLLQGRKQLIAISILRRRYSRPDLLALPPRAADGSNDVPNPFNTRASRPTIPVRSPDGRVVGKTHAAPNKTPVAIDVYGTIRCVNTGHTLWIAPGSRVDVANPGAAERLNPQYQPALHQVVADHRKENHHG